MAQTYFITGTDTAVGKTVLTVLLTQFLHARRIAVAALKPVCSGGRDDARALHAAMHSALTLDEINPWHFRAALAPALAARRERRGLTQAQVVAAIRAIEKKFAVVLVEGAGGLRSPLGDDFDSRDLIAALRATPLIVAPNRLGTVNHILLTLEALPKTLRPQAKVVLMSPPKPEVATASNLKLLRSVWPAGQIFTLPWLGTNFSAGNRRMRPSVQRTLAKLLE